MKIFIRLIALTLVAASLSACSGGTGSAYSLAWYDVYGRLCSTGSPTPGCDFHSDHSKIYVYQDPFWSMWPNDGQIWFSPDGIIYDSAGFAINGQKDEQESADVISAASVQAQKVAVVVGKEFAGRYALAEEKGIQISQTLQSWAKLGKDRARTESDVADFGRRLFGVDPVKAKSAIIKAAETKDPTDLEVLNVDVAAFWGTSPEVSKVILKNWYKDQLSTVGVK